MVLTMRRYYCSVTMEVETPNKSKIDQIFTFHGLKDVGEAGEKEIAFGRRLKTFGFQTFMDVKQ